MLMKALVIDSLAYIAIGFLGLTILITLGLGFWLMSHMGKKKA